MLDERNVKLSRARLALACEEYNVAQMTIDAEVYRIANTRAYYATFHAMRAVLALDDVDFKTHSQVIGYFRKNYIHGGVFDPSYSDIVRNASLSRNRSDYEDFYKAAREEAEKNAGNAKLFVEGVAEYVEQRIANEYIQQGLGGDEAADDFEDEYDGGAVYGNEGDEDDEDEWER